MEAEGPLISSGQGDHDGPLVLELSTEYAEQAESFAISGRANGVAGLGRPVRTP